MSKLIAALSVLGVLLFAALPARAESDDWLSRAFQHKSELSTNDDGWSRKVRHAARSEDEDVQAHHSRHHVARKNDDDDDKPVRHKRSSERTERSHRTTEHATRRHRDDEEEHASRRERHHDEEHSGQSGVASFYSEPQALASGGRFNPEAYTAAHRSLPFGTRVRVTRVDTGHSVEVTINDRGPYVGGRIIDLSRRAARDLDMTGAGVARVRVAVLGR